LEKLKAEIEKKTNPKSAAAKKQKIEAASQPQKDEAPSK
jgi:hypothetical protein